LITSMYPSDFWYLNVVLMLHYYFWLLIFLIGFPYATTYKRGYCGYSPVEVEYSVCLQPLRKRFGGASTYAYVYTRNTFRQLCMYMNIVCTRLYPN
jgi:hypothetical protein